MALIGTLRNKMTKWVVGFVAVAISAFVLNDLFGNGPRSVFGNENTVGEIGGSTITLEEYQAAIQERENNYILNFGRQPGDRERPLLQQQAWELLIAKRAIKPQFEKVGVQVTTDEVWDMIQGKNIDENVKSSFLDSAGNFDRSRLLQYINQFNIPAPIDPQAAAGFNEAKYRWTTFQQDLGLGRERIKYENLIVKTNYVTEAEAERDYHTQNDVAEVKYLYVPYFVVSDSSIKVSDSDLKDYYNRNKEKYKAEQTRSLSYVSFPIEASSADSTEIKLELEKIANDFKTVTEDSLFAAANTEGNEPLTRYTASTLPAFLADKSQLTVGNVIGPVLDGGSYKVVKIVKSGLDTIGTARASHILFKWDDETDAAKKIAKEKARKVLAEIKGGASFAAKAREFGTDASASQGGDLGSFSSGGMVKEFEKPVFAAKKTGLLSDVVETQYGYHIIDVTEVVDYTSYTVATIELEIAPSDETQNEAYLKAQNFAIDLSGLDDFTARAKEENLMVMTANDLKTADRRINNLGEARSLVTWLFRDAKIGKVSDVFPLDTDYVVAIMTDETEEGIRSFNDVKDEISPAVRNEVKGKQIIEKLKGKTGSFDELAKLFGTDAIIGSSSDLKLNSNTLPSVGLDPVAVGKIFSLENGKRSEPFAGENGVLVAELQNKTIAPAVGDYSVFRNQLLQGLNGKSAYAISEALKAGANIEDKRYKFF